jgi:hypothetical protein
MQLAWEWHDLPSLPEVVYCTSGYVPLRILLGAGHNSVLPAVCQLCGICALALEELCLVPIVSSPLVQSTAAGACSASICALDGVRVLCAQSDA